MPEQTQPQQPEVVRRRGESFGSIYANSLHVEATPWDFTFYFGEIEKGEPDPTGTRLAKIFVEDRVKITMSPQHAKAMLKVLQDNVTQYELQVGQIPTQPPAPPEVHKA
jgi:hypothetical protein